jgi:hypothetical protein
VAAITRLKLGAIQVGVCRSVRSNAEGDDVHFA